MIFSGFDSGVPTEYHMIFSKSNATPRLDNSIWTDTLNTVVSKTSLKLIKY